MIGIFDSGLGGLTAVKEITALLPDEDIIYFGDTGRVPYGTRSRSTIIRYALSDMRFLSSMNIRAAVAACGTVSTTALSELRRAFDIPIIGVVDSAARAAAEATANGIIAVIGTSATISSGAFERRLKEIKPDVRLICRACPMFVPLVENGFTGADDEVTRLVCERYLEPVRDSGADTLIMGCTHYPLIADAISGALPGVTLINTGAEAAKYLARSLPRTGGPETGRVRYFVSDDPEGFEASAAGFLGRSLGGSVEQVDIDRY